MCATRGADTQFSATTSATQIQTPAEMQELHDTVLESSGLGDKKNDSVITVQLLNNAAPENSTDKNDVNNNNNKNPPEITKDLNNSDPKPQVQVDAVPPEAEPSPQSPPSPPAPESPSPPAPESPSPEPSPSPDPSPSPLSPPFVEPSPPPPAPEVSPPPPPVVPSPPPPPARTPQQNALLSFKDSLSNGGTILSSWQEGTNECQTWQGVGCSNNVVTSLSLIGVGLQGQISAELANLAGLQKIDLSNNALSGSIPNSFNYPDALPVLAELKVAGNQLNGGPADWGVSGSKSLQNVDFSNNVLGFFPKWSFPALKFINVANNDLGGVIPTYFASVVPAGQPVVILPQRAALCGTLPPGPRWAEQDSTGQYRAITSLPPNSACGMMPPPPPAPFPPPGALPPSPSSSGLSTGAIIGIAVGGSVALILLVALFFMLCRPKATTADDGHYSDDDYKYLTNNEKVLLGGIITKKSSQEGDIESNPDASAYMSNQSGVSARNAHPVSPTGSVRSHGRVPSTSHLNLDVKMWTVAFNDLRMERQIGEGSFGRVFLAKWNETLVAVKILTSIAPIDDEAALTLSNPVLSSLAKESNMMAALRHPNVVGFLGVCLEPPCIVTEYCARGSLTDVLRGAKTSPQKASMLDWSKRLNMALDAAKGMLYLHNHAPPIVHRDLKSPNLLVDKHWRLKVSDFNLSKLVGDETVMSSMAATNPRWLAPEILGGNNASFASDVYSFGVVMWELLTWELPWGVTNPWQVVTMVMEGGRLTIPPREQLPGPDTDTFVGLDDYVDLMRRCWSQIQEDRPTFQEIISDLRKILSDTLDRRIGGQDSRGGTPKLGAHAISDDGGDGGDDTTDMAGRSSHVSEDDDCASTDAYASTAPVTGSLGDVGALKQSWGSIVGSKIKSGFKLGASRHGS